MIAKLHALSYAKKLTIVYQNFIVLKLSSTWPLRHSTLLYEVRTYYIFNIICGIIYVSTCIYHMYVQ